MAQSCSLTTIHSGNLDSLLWAKKFPDRVAYSQALDQEKTNACHALRASTARGPEPEHVEFPAEIALIRELAAERGSLGTPCSATESAAL